MNLPNLKKDGEAAPKKKDENKFEWHDEGVSTLVRIVILGWSGAILTLNYVSIPGLEQRQIDPTFIASVFTGCLASFNIQTSKKKEEKEDNNQKKVADQTDSPK